MRCLLLVLLLLCCANGRCAPELVAKASDAAATPTSRNLPNLPAPGRIIKVGLVPNAQAPLDIQDSRGGYHGISIDFLNAIVTVTGARSQFSYLAYPDTNALEDALRRGEIDIATSIVRTGTHAGLAFGVSYRTGRLVIVQRRDEPVRTSAQGGAGTRLVYVPTDMSSVELKQRVAAGSYIPLKTDLEAVQAVAFGQADLYVGNYTVASWLIGQLQLRNLAISNFAGFEQDGYYLATRSGDSLLRQWLDEGIRAIPLATRQDIQSRWDLLDLPVLSINKINLTPAETAWIKANPVVQYVTLDDLAPFFFLGQNQKPAGLITDLLARVQQLTGLRFAPFYAKSVVDIPAIMREPKPRLLVYAPAELPNSNWNVSYPYANALWVLVGRRGTPPPGFGADHRQTLGVTGGEAMYSALVGDDKAPGKIVNYATPRALFEALAAGDIDFALSDISVANYLIGEFYKDKLTILGTLASRPTRVGLGVSLQSPELLDIVNKVILSLPPGYMEGWENSWLSEGHPDPTWQRYRAQIVGGLASTTTLALLAAVGCALLFQQVRRRKKVEAELSANLARDQALVNNLPVAIFTSDLNGALVRANRAYLESTAQSLAQVQGRPLQDLPVTSAPEVQQLIFNREHATRSADIRTTLQEISHDLYFWATSFDDGRGKPAGYTGGWLDVSTRVALENELRQARDEAARSNQIKSVFLAGMSHEVRTPLSVIIGILDLRLDTTTDPDAVSQLLAARGSALHLLALVDEILELSRIESRVLQLHPAPLHLATLAAELREVFQLQASSKGLNFQCLEQNTASDILIDPVRLRQIITNLVSNAVKFTNEGSVTLALTLHPATDAQAAELRIRVTDTGIGIAQEHQALLFEPFYRATTAGPEIYEGTGLGLAVTRRLVAAMGGRLEFQSVLQTGTTFEAWLPVEIVTASAHAAAMPEGNARSVSGQLWFPGLAVLLVDDHPVNRLIVRGQLEKLGCVVQEAQDGFAALAAMRTEHFGLIVIDCAMPRMSGPQLAMTIRNGEAGDTHYPLIGITASLAGDVHRQALDAGMDSCQLRPVSQETWSSLLDQYCWEYSDLRTDYSAITDDEHTGVIRRVLESSLSADLHTANDLLAQTEFAGLADIMHRIKGPFSMLGRSELVAACAEVESACMQEQPQWQSVRDLLRRLERMCAQYMAQGTG